MAKYVPLEDDIVTDLGKMFLEAQRIASILHPSGEEAVRAAFPVAIRLMWEHFIRNVAKEDLMVIEGAARRIADELWAQAETLGFRIPDDDGELV